MATATQTSKILSAEQEAKLRQPIDEYVGKIQAQIDELRTDGTEKAVNIQNELDNLKRDRIYTAQEKTERETKLKAELAAAKAVEEKNKGQINKLIADAEAYLKAHYDSDYYHAVVASCKQEKVQAQQKYQAAVEQLKKEHETALSKLSNQQEIKDEKYVHKNRLFDAKMQLDKDCQAIKDRRHAAFDYKYHLIDMLRLSKFTVGESLAQKWENYKYTFNRRDFLLRNGLYIAIVIIFIILCLIAQFGKKVPLLTVNNILNILQQASPRMFLALGVAGLILLAGTSDRLIWAGAADRIGRIDGIVMVALYIALMWFTIRTTKRPEAAPADAGAKKPAALWLAVVMIAGGLAGLIFGGDMFLRSATEIARRLGISESVIAITLVAGGTSLPELASSVVSLLKGKSEMALGNVIGSNIANILLILGVSATIRPLTMGGITTTDILMVVLSSLLLLLTAFTFRRKQIDRWEGAIFLMIYIAYIWYLIR